MVLDACEASMLSLCIAVLSPLAAIQIFLHPASSFVLAGHYLRFGLLSVSLRAHLDGLLGRFDQELTAHEYMARLVEDYVVAHSDGYVERQLLLSIYNRLARKYLTQGSIEDALVVLLRAQKILGVDRLPDLRYCDTKTAHILKAAFAAGKILEQQNISGLTVTTMIPAVSKNLKSADSSKPKTKKPTNPNVPPVIGAKVIQFPSAPIHEH